MLADANPNSWAVSAEQLALADGILYTHCDLDPEHTKNFSDLPADDNVQAGKCLYKCLLNPEGITAPLSQSYSSRMPDKTCLNPTQTLLGTR